MRALFSLLLVRSFRVVQLQPHCAALAVSTAGPCGGAVLRRERRGSSVRAFWLIKRRLAARSVRNPSDADEQYVGVGSRRTGTASPAAAACGLRPRLYFFRGFWPRCERRWGRRGELLNQRCARWVRTAGVYHRRGLAVTPGVGARFRGPAWARTLRGTNGAG